jgi:quinol monooxygenase YgiN
LRARRSQSSLGDPPHTREISMRAILAYLTAKPGKEAEFLEKMTAQAKRCLANEPGCLQFDVAQDPKNPARLVMLEVYKDDVAIKAHQESQHFIDFRPVVGELVADRKVEVLHLVSDGRSKRS